jgi:hypothetical protein
MNVFKRLVGWLRPQRAGSPEERAAAEDGARIRDEMASTRLSTMAGSGAENYQTQRKPHR